jgi:hypothetical protein
MAVNPANHDRARGKSYSFGEVGRSVNTGPGTQITAEGNQYIVSSVPDFNAWDELFQGRGIGRRLLALGLCVTTGGAAAFVLAVLSLMTSAGSDQPVGGGSGVSLAVAGFAVLLIGGMISSIGMGLSKSARMKHARSFWNGQ